MTEVLLSNDDIVVFGPPATIEVLVDIGPTGTRGSQTFVGLGDPNIVGVGQTPLINDMYIDAASSIDYSYLYQYVSEPGGSLWVKVLKMNPAIYSNNIFLSFDNGAASLTIPIASIVSTTNYSLTADNFNVQYSLLHDNPIASSIEVPALVGDESNLVINFNAIENSTGTWQNLDEIIKANIFISIALDNSWES